MADLGALRRKFVDNVASSRNRCTIAAVFEAKKEIPV
jgi:hypothetical protein